MNEKFDYVVLPPDAFHITLRDRLFEARHYTRDVLDVVSHIRKPGERVVVKYRNETHYQNFPANAEARIGYGGLLDLCAKETIVIGFPGSAMLECLLNDIRFYAFWNYGFYEKNKHLSLYALNRLIEIIHIARSNDELADNLAHQRIFKPGRAKGDLLHQHGIALHEIVANILGSTLKKNLL